MRNSKIHLIFFYLGNNRSDGGLVRGEEAFSTSSEGRWRWKRCHRVCRRWKVDTATMMIDFTPLLTLIPNPRTPSLGALLAYMCADKLGWKVYQFTAF